MAEGEIIALVNARVIDGTGAPAHLDWTVLIQGTRIIIAGPDVAIPAGARILDLTGQTLLPGMLDMHGHLYTYDGEGMAMEYTAYPRLYLAGGVTTIFTAGDFDPRGAIALRDQIANGEAVGPHILAVGPYFSGGNAPSWMLKAQTPDEMRAVYEAWNDQSDGVKVYTHIPEDQFIALLNAAHADGLSVTGHLESISGMRAIELGIDGIEHGLFSMSGFLPKGTSFREQYCAVGQLDLTSPEVSRVIDALVRQGTYLDPTIVVFLPELPDFVPLLEDWEKYLDPGAVMPLRRALRSMIQPTCLHEALDKQAQFVKAVHDRDGLIVTGTDPVIPILLPGYSLHRDLQNLVDARLSPLVAPWREGMRLELGQDAGRLLLEGKPAAIPPGWRVRARRPGDRMRLQADGPSRTLKHFFQSAAIPPWLRSGIPVLEWDGAPVALGDWMFGHRLRTWLLENGLEYRWEPDDSVLARVRADLQR